MPPSAVTVPSGMESANPRAEDRPVREPESAMLLEGVVETVGRGRTPSRQVGLL